MTDKASTIYQVRLVKSSYLRRVASWAMTVFQASSGEGTAPPWKYEAVVVDKGRSRVVRTIRNSIGGQDDDVGMVKADLETMTRTEFESVWYLRS